MNYKFTINKLDIQQSYFKGFVKSDKEEYSINIQEEKRGKILKTPFPIKTENRVLVRFTGIDAYIEDFLEYAGMSEWLEIDSDIITYHLADNQDKHDTIEIITL